MSNKKSMAKKRVKNNKLPIIIAGAAIILLFAIVFTIVAIATSRANGVVGKTYEVSKVKVTLSANATTELANMGISVSDLSNDIAKELKEELIVFEEDQEGKEYKIEKNRVTIMGTEYKRSFGKLIGEIKYSDGITVKVTLKVKK